MRLIFTIIMILSWMVLTAQKDSLDVKLGEMASREVTEAIQQINEAQIRIQKILIYYREANQLDSTYQFVGFVPGNGLVARFKKNGVDDKK